jgi:cell pole-organizing protein PopZ
MSEQTPESTSSATDEDGFGATDVEPSMEDILASIRKIISDDADPIALDGPAAATVESSVTAPDAPAVTAPIPTVADDVDAFDIDALLGELDMADAQPTSLDIGDMAPLESDLAIPEIEPETFNVEADGDNMDRIMSDLMGDMEEPITPSEDPVLETVTSASTDQDMDVVKSLMADLTDAPIEAETAQEGPDTFDMDALMANFDNFDDTPVADATPAKGETISDADDLDAMEDDIFDSILEMTLDDEVDALNEADMSIPSLSDIASAAESEAVVEPAAIVDVTAVAAAAVVTVQTADDADAETAVAAAEPAPVIPEPAQPAPSEMETPMQSALRSDAILDDVTESATMSAFAELNQVVEDKAILSERGPRIGDLVQDALKPMLKEWLDENIQGIVERAVAKEVKRIATGK